MSNAGQRRRKQRRETPFPPLFAAHLGDDFFCRRLLHRLSRTRQAQRRSACFVNFTRIRRRQDSAPSRCRLISANLSFSFDASPRRGEGRPVVLLSEIQQADWLCWPGCDVRRWNEKTRLTNRSGRLRCSTGVGTERRGTAARVRLPVNKKLETSACLRMQ
ncbi:unnamed protein product [Ixodes pacificus]